MTMSLLTGAFGGWILKPEDTGKLRTCRFTEKERFHQDRRFSQHLNQRDVRCLQNHSTIVGKPVCSFWMVSVEEK